MLKGSFSSLLFRLGLIMLAIVTLAIAGTISSLLIANAVKGEADSVNLAGSLRMQSYRIATSLAYSGDVQAQTYRHSMQLLLKDFEQQLYNTDIIRILPQQQDHELTAAYQQVIRRWQHEIRPLLDSYIASITKDSPVSAETHNSIRNRYLELTPLFVDGIDHFVDLLAEDAESKIDRLHLYQMMTLLFILLMVVLALYLTHLNVVQPLKALLSLSEKAGNGDFSMRTPYQGKDELGRLGRAFNLMSEDLDQLYRDLENRVSEKTNDLERSKRSLELLYRTVNRLSIQSSRPDTYRMVLKDVEELAETGPGMICLSDNLESGATALASTFPKEHAGLQPCLTHDCNTCLGNGDNQASLLAFDNADGNTEHIIATPITDHSKQYGVLLTQLPAGQKLETWQKRLLETVANHLGIALTLAHQQTEHRRVALLEERGVIARELHDSLAQALSYLKIQVTRLEKSLKTSPDKSEAIIHELREGLGSAYRELRELLTTFRLRMDEQSLEDALEETITEFRKRCTIDLTLDYQIKHCELNANEEIHLLQIVREALSNVVNHSQATQCRTRLSQLDDKLLLSIDDNGIGMTAATSKLHHYGTTIMQERARGLNGLLEFGSSSLGGLQVLLTFTPNRFHTPVELKAG